MVLDNTARRVLGI